MLASAISLGFANLAVLVLNQFIFRDRPLVDYELSNLLYASTDSSFLPIRRHCPSLLLPPSGSVIDGQQLFLLP